MGLLSPKNVVLGILIGYPATEVDLLIPSGPRFESWWAHHFKLLQGWDLRTATDRLSVKPIGPSVQKVTVRRQNRRGSSEWKSRTVKE